MRRSVKKFFLHASQATLRKNTFCMGIGFLNPLLLRLSTLLFNTVIPFFLPSQLFSVALL
ncbi:hypothetical protein HCUR_00057 [Holospora curviuscula]|uniref:Uncharacterized protein n=1 Tax=Holospora curviuscula TaxID=1082868 RepID=A0A2S5RHV8_9PROT|nr:hypothetical protein HCUR_00057 [Holospora curviuscula]